MSFRKTIALAAALQTAACSTTGIPLQIELVGNGYNIPCDVIQQGHAPLNPDYCANDQENVSIPPSIYNAKIDRFVDAYNCAFNGLLTLHPTTEISEAPEDFALFLGGNPRPINNGKDFEGGLTVGDSSGDSVTYVTDHNLFKEPLAACHVLRSMLHEAGHLLLNKALEESNQKRFQNLDKHKHDPPGSNTLMAPSGNCKTSLNFSQQSANAIAENIDLEDTPFTADQVRVNLQSIAERCSAEIAAVIQMPTPVK